MGLTSGTPNIRVKTGDGAKTTSNAAQQKPSSSANPAAVRPIPKKASAQKTASTPASPSRSVIPSVQTKTSVSAKPALKPSQSAKGKKASRIPSKGGAASGKQKKGFKLPFMSDKLGADGSVQAMTPNQEREQVKRLSLITAMFAAVLIIALGYAIWTTLTTQSELASMSSNLRRVYVATEDIIPGTVIDESMVALDEIPMRYVTSDATDDISDILGRVSLINIAKQTQIDSSMVFGLGNNSSLATAINQDEYAVTITVSAETGVAGLLKQGDYVDIYCLTGADEGVQGASLVLANVPVVALDSDLSNTGNMAYSTITLDVPTASDVTRILDAKQRGTLTCVLHATDVNILNAQSATPDDGVLPIDAVDAVDAIQKL